MADSRNYNPLLGQYGNRNNPLRTYEQDFGRYEGSELAKTHNKFEEVLPGLSPAAGAYIKGGDTMLAPRASSNKFDILTDTSKAYVLGGDSTPMGLGDTGFNQQDNFDFGYYAQPKISGNGYDASGFNGFNQSQMKTDGSLASVGAGVGALAGGPVGSAIGAVGGTAVDMYLSYQANEERKKADRQRLEEARRQQQFSNRQAERDRKLAASQYGDKMGFLNAQEDRTQATFEANTKQNRLNMLQNAMTNSLKNSEMVRNIFAKRGVV
tara:strand:- start:228 stop:1028 length:801 start_codon:yes stop_codon:yes gene_type:complete